MTETEGATSRAERRTREQWAALLSEYAASGQSQRGFCAARGIGQSSLRYWKRRLEQEGTTQDGPTGRGTRLVPIKLVADTPVRIDSALVVVLHGGIRVQIARDFDAPTLARVLASLEAA